MRQANMFGARIASIGTLALALAAPVALRAQSAFCTPTLVTHSSLASLSFDATLQSTCAKNASGGYDYFYTFNLVRPLEVNPVTQVVYGSASRTPASRTEVWTLANQGPPSQQAWHAVFDIPFGNPRSGVSGSVWYPKTFSALSFSIDDYSGAPGQTVSVFGTLTNPNSADWNVTFGGQPMSSGANRVFITSVPIASDARPGFLGTFSGGGTAVYAGGSVSLADDFSIFVTPEPSALGLAATGLAGIVLLRRRLATTPWVVRRPRSPRRS